jgi:ATP-dependent DNA ligase
MGLRQPVHRWLHRRRPQNLIRRRPSLQSRNGNDLARRFPGVVDAAAELGDVVLDGELVALRDGRMDFAAMASAPASRASAGVVYYVAFDLLAVAGDDLRPQPHRLRRDELTALFDGANLPLQWCR